MSDLKVRPLVARHTVRSGAADGRIHHYSSAERWPGRIHGARPSALAFAVRAFRGAGIKKKEEGLRLDLKCLKPEPTPPDRAKQRLLLSQTHWLGWTVVPLHPGFENGR